MSWNTFARAIEWKRSLPTEVSGDVLMMVAVFATMTLALILGWFGRRSLAVELFAACLVLSIGLFLFEIYSPEYGFRMPWIQTELHQPPLITS